ncbi:hypothetical protein C1645_814629 [Glomus cerebriforme]|uniref:NmrA-like domain-containing protein n=1 Tax=Glomus cerebriforme TaxID=658196 RepID=A0A397TFT1_9GLOM|nr:hypothetical protein C1645_814629 [Glomus cerebriforme]
MSQNPLIVVTGATGAQEDIKNALNGADIVWLNTNFWDQLLKDVDFGEEERVKNGEIEVAIYALEENIKLPMIDVDADTDPIIAKIIEEGPAKWNGKKIPVASEDVPLKHIIDVLTKVTGITHKLRTLNDEDNAKVNPAKNNEQVNQMEFGLFGKDEELNDISISKKLHPNIKNFEQYAHETYGND